MVQTMTGLLPGGYVDKNGVLQREVQLIALRGCEEELIANARAQGLAQGNAALVTALLSRCVQSIGAISPVSTELIRQLLIADRLYLLLKLRQATFGDAVRTSICCPWRDCGQRVALNFALSDVPITASNQAGSVYKLALAEEKSDVTAEDARHLEIVFRLPNGEDQEAIERLNLVDQTAAQTALLNRCILQIGALSRPDQATLDQLASSVRLAIQQTMDALAPQVELTMETSCHECGRAFVVPFDLAAFFLGEVHANLDLLYREVHFLAYHYHWSEREIMELPSAKRRNYIDILVDELEQLNGESVPGEDHWPQTLFAPKLEAFKIEAWAIPDGAKAVEQMRTEPGAFPTEPVKPQPQRDPLLNFGESRRPLGAAVVPQAAGRSEAGEQAEAEGDDGIRRQAGSDDAGSSNVDRLHWATQIEPEEWAPTPIATEAAVARRPPPAATVEIPGVTPRRQGSNPAVANVMAMVGSAAQSAARNTAAREQTDGGGVKVASAVPGMIVANAAQSASAHAAMPTVSPAHSPVSAPIVANTSQVVAPPLAVPVAPRQRGDGRANVATTTRHDDAVREVAEVADDAPSAVVANVAQPARVPVTKPTVNPAPGPVSAPTVAETSHVVAPLAAPYQRGGGPANVTAIVGAAVQPAERSTVTREPADGGAEEVVNAAPGMVVANVAQPASAHAATPIVSPAPIYVAAPTVADTSHVVAVPLAVPAAPQQRGAASASVGVMAGALTTATRRDAATWVPTDGGAVDLVSDALGAVVANAAQAASAPSAMPTVSPAYSPVSVEAPSSVVQAVVPPLAVPVAFQQDSAVSANAAAIASALATTTLRSSATQGSAEVGVVDMINSAPGEIVTNSAQPASAHDVASAVSLVHSPVSTPTMADTGQVVTLPLVVLAAPQQSGNAAASRSASPSRAARARSASTFRLIAAELAESGDEADLPSVPARDGVLGNRERAVQSDFNRQAAQKIEELRQVVRELTAKAAVPVPPEAAGNANSVSQPPAEQAPPPVQQRIVIKQAPSRKRLPHAFWERNYLKRYQLRMMR